VEFSNGYAISIVAESTKGCLLSVDAEYDTNLNTPEDVGERAALRLLDEI
jgi:RNA 3'-terminal phosphate cyclase